MAYTQDLQVANGALLRLGAEPITALTEVSDRAVLCNQWIVSSRQESLRSHPWNFALHRTQVSTFPQATLTPGAVTGLGVAFIASAPVFAAGDVGTRLIATTGSARVTAFVSTTQVTADIETDFANVNPIAVGDWRIAPAYGWAFRFAKPTDYLRVIEIEATGSVAGSAASSGVFFWSWWKHRGNAPEPVKVEGQFLLSDAGGKMNIQFIRDISDVSLWDVNATDAWEAYLAYKIAYGVTGSLNAAKTQWEAYRAILSGARTTDAQEGGGDEYASDILLSVRQ